MKTMTGNFSGVLRTAGFGICLFCAAYMLYYAASRRTIADLGESGARGITIVGMAAVTEGKVVRAENGYTVIRYYHVWDGTDYQKVIARENEDYPENAAVPVIYTVGMGAGSCLVPGFYRRLLQAMNAAGAIMLLLGIILGIKKKGKKKWQEKKS